MMEKLIAMRNSKKKGFTLIELIVVIAILAILAALAVPAYNGLKEDSAKQVGLANVRTAYTAYKAAEALNTPAASIDAKVDSMLGTDMDGDVSVSGTTVTWKGKVGAYYVTATYENGNPGTPTAVKDKPTGWPEGAGA